VAVHALLVGIDAYQDPIPPLRGAVRDIRRAAEFLRVRVPAGELFPVVLTDAVATRAAIIDGFRSHLAAAGPDDTALFWFSGHGSQMPVPEWFATTETTGFLQTLVCADSRIEGTPDLLDKEIRILISRIADRGTHVVAVLDCCHSDGASREGGPESVKAPASVPSALGIRWAPPERVVPPAHLLLPELAEFAEPGGPAHRLLGRPDNHVSLAACRSFEAAYEVPADGGHRGVFSLMLLRRLAEPGISYRNLLALTRCLVETEVPGQHPVLDPVVGPLPDQPFLGGHAVATPTTMTLRQSAGSWHVDAGSCHGMAVGTATDPMMLGLRDDPLHRRLRVAWVNPDRSGVEPVGWQPSETDLGRPLVLTRVPFPRTTVVVGDEVGGGSNEPVRRFTTRLITDALESAGPAGAASPFLRRLEPGDAHTLAALRVAFPAQETAVICICGSDGTRLDAPMRCTSSRHALELVRRLEHIARWRDVLELDNPCSRLAGAVAVEVVEALPGEEVDPVHRAPLIPAADGAVHLSYRYTRNGWAPPHGVFLRLRNRSDRMLYCVLLDLTDRFRMHPYLFAGNWVASGTAYVGDGCRIDMTLPPGREPVPGARGVDWLKVLVAEAPIDSALFELPRLGEPGTGRSARPAQPAQPAWPAPRAAGLSGVIDRLGFTAMYRELDPVPPRTAEWTTSVTTVVTAVPER
jgi:hypothetical protein